MNNNTKKENLARDRLDVPPQRIMSTENATTTTGMGSRESTETFHQQCSDIAALGAAVERAVRESMKDLDRAQDSFEMHVARCESDDRRLDDERRVFRREWLLQERGKFSADNAELAFIGDQLAEEEGRLQRDEFVEEAILGRKVHRGVLYYKVAWRGRNAVTWEREEDLDNKRMIESFEREFLARAMMPRTSRLRPATYITRRLREANPALRARLDAVRGARGGAVTWLCEVEPFIWIPYDESTSAAIEQAFARGDEHAQVYVNNHAYVVQFGSTVGTDHSDQTTTSFQQRSDVADGDASRRSVRRVVQLDPDDEVRMLEQMSIDELREYIATIPEILPHHYDALQRFHEADRVQVRRSTEEVMQRVTVSTFGSVLESVAEGTATYPGFTSECFVCLEDYEVTDQVAHLQCGHFLHRICAIDYFEKYSRLCPICKAEVV